MPMLYMHMQRWVVGMWQAALAALAAVGAVGGVGGGSWAIRAIARGRRGRVGCRAADDGRYSYRHR